MYQDFSQSYNIKTYDLNRIVKAAKALGSPHLKFSNNIYITGTNGKGSVASFLKSIGILSGLKVNAFTSPHIKNKNERIMIQNEFIRDDYLDELFRKIEATKLEVSWFEKWVLVSYMAFVDYPADFNIIEVGIGARLDATNIINNIICSVITSISMDHTDYLGDSLEQIAIEKSFVMRPHSICFVSHQNDTKIYQTLSKLAKIHGSSICSYGYDFYLTKDSDVATTKDSDVATTSDATKNSGETNEINANKDSIETKDSDVATNSDATKNSDKTNEINANKDSIETNDSGETKDSDAATTNDSTETNSGETNEINANKDSDVATTNDSIETNSGETKDSDAATTNDSIETNEINANKDLIETNDSGETKDSNEAIIKSSDADAATTNNSRQLVISHNEKKLDMPNPSLRGKHQFYNAATAVLVANYLKNMFPGITGETIYKGIQSAKIPGRLELIEYKGLKFFLDGAHNPGGALVLSDWMQSITSPKCIIFGMKSNKDVSEFVKILFTNLSVKDKIICVDITIPGLSFVPKEELYEIVSAYNLNCVISNDAIKAISQHQDQFTVLCTGSLFLVGNLYQSLDLHVNTF